MSTPYIRKDQAAKETTFLKLALAHARTTQRGGPQQEPLPTISPKTPEFEAWRRYFVDHLGFEPIAMKRVRLGYSQEMTVPAERPEEFDGSYRRRAFA
jgi:hypothetical protein